MEQLTCGIISSYVLTRKNKCSYMRGIKRQHHLQSALPPPLMMKRLFQAPLNIGPRLFSIDLKRSLRLLRLIISLNISDDTSPCF